MDCTATGTRVSGLNWTKVGLKGEGEAHEFSLNFCLNWTKVGLKASLARHRAPGARV